MRDIRSDLKERLGSIAKEREAIQASVQGRLSELEKMEAGINALLRLEDRTFRSTNGNGHSHAADGGSTPLARLILTTLNAAKRPLTVDEFKEAAHAAKFDFGDKSPGRVIHWGLVGMAQGGTIEKDGGKWQFVKGVRN